MCYLIIMCQVTANARLCRAGGFMCLYPRTVLVHPKIGDPYYATVKCGKCFECARLYSVEWAFRILDECKQYKHNCFLTLTYNNENLPVDKSVSRREVQLFVKRLRFALSPLRVRFFACGEYGKRLARPHYHIVVFGWCPDDLRFWQMDGKNKLYRSAFVERIWTKGFSSVGLVTYDTALYVAKYMNKLSYDKRVTKLSRPFVQMSNRPGIGAASAFNVDLVGDRIYRDGRSCKIPRYYLKLQEREGVYLDDLKARRIIDGQHKEQFRDLEKRRKQLREFYSRHIVSRSN